MKKSEPQKQTKKGFSGQKRRRGQLFSSVKSVKLKEHPDHVPMGKVSVKWDADVRQKVTWRKLPVKWEKLFGDFHPLFQTKNRISPQKISLR